MTLRMLTIAAAGVAALSLAEKARKETAAKATDTPTPADGTSQDRLATGNDQQVVQQPWDEPPPQGNTAEGG